MRVKVGSLFDGIGGAPLSAVLSGAEPVWASEIEKIPISITKRHFPNMRHYGDITQINGAEIEPVDIIVGGSPCQDLSVAGNRAGLEGARSGLFMDQVRIVKEMRNETTDRSNKLPRPRYMVWENVPGAFSSNKGEDFRAVLEEICRVCDPEASIPEPAKNKWLSSGTILGDGYSLAWRIVDAQYWGVPQRRRRIYLVADFRGHTAPEILFEQESVSGYLETSGKAEERIAADAEGGTGGAGELVLNDQGGSVMGVSYGVTGTLRAQEHGHQPIVLNTVDRQAVCYGFSYKASSHAGTIGIEQEKAPTLLGARHDAAIYYQHTIDQNGGNPACNQGGLAVVQSLYENHPADSRVTGPHEVCPTVTRRWGTGGNNVPLVMAHGQADAEVLSDQAPTLNCNHEQPVVCRMVAFGEYATDGTCSTMKQRDYKDATDLVVEPVYSLDRACFNQGINAKYGMSIEENTAQTSVARGPSAVASPEQKYTVRRLTPLECERLQGYPDGWTALDHEDKAVSDTQRYKALGNSFAVPNALFVISRCVKQLQKDNGLG